MFKLLGICVHSLSSVYDELSPFFKAKDIKATMVSGTSSIILNKEWVRKHYGQDDVLMFNGVVEFNRVMPFLEDLNVVCMVFESPLLLRCYDCMEILDADNSGLSYNFKLQELDYPKIKALLLKAKSGKLKHIKVAKNTFELIPTIIDSVKEGGFLDKFNALIYSTSNHTNRSTYVLEITKHLFGINDRRQMDKFFKKRLPTKGKGMTLYGDMEKYLDTEKGKNLVIALTLLNKANRDENGKTKKKAKGKISYKAMSKKYGIDKYELRYLNLLYRRIINGSGKSGTIKELADKVKNRGK